MQDFKKKLYRLEYKYGRYAIHNLMSYICVTMLAVYFLQMLLRAPIIPFLSLSRGALLQGQVWRLITFIFIPPISTPFFTLISLYFYYFIGNSLEQQWGVFKFNLYYATGIIFAIIAALISGYGTVTYLNLSLFLAFAQLFPDTQFMLFFFIPIKAKYLAYFNLFVFGIQFFMGGWSAKLAILLAVANFLLLFGRDFIDGLRRFRKYNNATRVNFRREMRERDRRNRQ